MLDICLLGTGGMMPMPSRFLTAMLARLNGRLALIDCGEGTQVTMKMLGWGFKAIDVICFTHFHADHISGLPGLLIGQAASDDWQRRADRTPYADWPCRLTADCRGADLDCAGAALSHRIY